MCQQFIYMLQEYSRDGVNGNHNDRIDMFVLLDLIGTADTQFTKLEQSTGNLVNCNISKIFRKYRMKFSY